MKKTLYGLKHAPKAWYSRIESYFKKEGYHKYLYEHALFIKTKEDRKMLLVYFYINDLIFIGNDEIMVVEFKSLMKMECEMTIWDICITFLALK